MGRKVFVGNLSFDVTDDDLREAFSNVGSVVSSKVIADRETGRSRGFGFVEFSTDNEASAAIETWDGREMNGRALNVNEAQDKAPKRSGGGGQPPPRDGQGGGGRKKKGKGNGKGGQGRAHESDGYNW
jgi:RNA recognition motif-containing protein